MTPTLDEAIEHVRKLVNDAVPRQDYIQWHETELASILAAMMKAKERIEELEVQSKLLSGVIRESNEWETKCYAHEETIATLTAKLNTANEVNDAAHESRRNLSTYATTLSDENFNLTMAGLDVVTRDCLKSLTAKLATAEKVVEAAMTTCDKINRKAWGFDGDCGALADISQLEDAIEKHQALAEHRKAGG